MTKYSGQIKLVRRRRIGFSLTSIDEWRVEPVLRAGGEGAAGFQAEAAPRARDHPGDGAACPRCRLPVSDHPATPLDPRRTGPARHDQFCRRIARRQLSGGFLEKQTLIECERSTTLLRDLEIAVVCWIQENVKVHTCVRHDDGRHHDRERLPTVDPILPVPARLIQVADVPYTRENLRIGWKLGVRPYVVVRNLVSVDVHKHL